MSDYPPGWYVALFRDLVTLKRGVDLPVQNRKEGEVPIFGSNGIVGFHSMATQDHPGIVTGRSGSIGNVYLNKKPFWALNTTLYSDQTHGNEIEYIYHFLKWFDLSRFSGGTGVPTLNRNDVHDQPIAIPPLPEQKKIAEILSGIDNHIRLTTIQISKTEELERGLLKEVFSAPDLSPSDGDAPTVSELESDGLITLGRGNIISKQDIQRLPGGFPIYSSSGKGDGKFGEYGEHMFDEELITWSIDGGGRLFHRKRHKFSVTNVCGYLRINKPHLDYRYAHLALWFQHGRSRFDYSFKAHPSAIREIYRIPVPPLERQKEVANIFDGIERTRLALLEKNLQLTNMKSAVASDLLSGRKRVRV